MNKKIAENEGAFVELLNQEMKELQESQKQIEEMATEIARIILSCPLNQGRNCDCCKFNDKDTISYDCQSYLVAEKLLEKYQPKTPENAVVLTREEYERLQALKDDYVKGYEAGVSEGWDNAREEMAEKFAKRLKEEFDYDEILCSTVDRIVKEITEGEGIEIYKQGFKEGVEALKIQAKERKFEIVTDAGNREDVVFVEDIDEIVKELCE